MRALGVLLATAAGLMAQPAFDSQKLLDGFLKQVSPTLERQPNYTCLETVERTRRSPGGATQVEDTLRLEVALVGDKEMFAWPGSKEFEDTEVTELVTAGMFGNGNFAIYPRMLFGGGGPASMYGGEVEVNGRKTAQFNFQVPRSRSGYRLSVNRQRAVVGYHGSFYVDLETLDLKRVVVILDMIPAEFNMTSSEDRVDYERVRIGEERFLLPVESSLTMVFPDTVSRNRVRFTACRKFTGESTLLFPEEDPVAADAPAAAGPKEVSLPIGTQIPLTLTTEIVLAQGVVGDTVAAKISSNVKIGKDVLVPKGTIARGRIVKLERQLEVYVLTLHFTDLEWPGGHARLNMRVEDVNAVAQGRSQENFFRIASDDIVISRNGPKRLKDLLLRGRVAP